jgi:hypothetical protein
VNIKKKRNIEVIQKNPNKTRPQIFIIPMMIKVGVRY